MPKPVTRTLKAGNSRLQEKMCQYGILNSPIVKFITIVIRGNDVQKKDVLSFCIKTTQSELHLRKHLPERGLKGFKKGRGSIIIYLDLIKLVENY